jgi:glycosyltransferase involved in cell wall biosynthesis
LRIAIIGSRGLLTEYSGIESMLRELCPRLVRRGHSVAVFGERFAQRSFEGVALEHAMSFGGRRMETLSRSLCATLQALAGRFDLLHFHDVAPALYGPLSRLRGVPSVLTLHSLDWRRDQWSRGAKTAIKLIERIAVGSASRITVVSEPLRKYVRDTYGRDSVVLPNVVEPRPRVPAGAFSAKLGIRERQYVLFVGRLVSDKAPHTLIRAFNALDTDMKLVIVGRDRHGGRYASDLRAIADAHTVIFTGHVSAAELAELYSNAYLFVLPSLVEGCSMAILEAMAYGTPVLVSDTPENLFTIGSDGLAFRAGDTSDLTTQLDRLLENPAHLECRRATTAASWDKIVERYEKVYSEALRN